MLRSKAKSPCRLRVWEVTCWSKMGEVRFWRPVILVWGNEGPHRGGGQEKKEQIQEV